MTQETPSRRCTAFCSDGSPCRAWAVRTSDPPRCAAHGGGSAPVGAPPGNQNARTHGYYARPLRGQDELPQGCTLDRVIIALYEKQQSLARYIDDHYGDLTPEQTARLFQVYQQGSSRLGRHLRDRRALQAPISDALHQAIHQALDELNNDLGINL